MIRPHLRYAVYVIRHKWFVFLAGLRTGAPLGRLLIHDWSKLTPTEWGPYVRRFASGRGGVLDKALDPDDFQRAWTHHWHVNPHHWEHWLAFKGDGTTKPLQMPERLVREMVADWMGAGRAQTGCWEVAEWYARNRDRIHIHDDTRERVEALIGQ